MSSSSLNARPQIVPVLLADEALEPAPSAGSSHQRWTYSQDVRVRQLFRVLGPSVHPGVARGNLGGPGEDKCKLYVAGLEGPEIMIHFADGAKFTTGANGTHQETDMFIMDHCADLFWNFELKSVPKARFWPAKLLSIVCQAYKGRVARSSFVEPGLENAYIDRCIFVGAFPNLPESDVTALLRQLNVQRLPLIQFFAHFALDRTVRTNLQIDLASKADVQTIVQKVIQYFGRKPSPPRKDLSEQFKDWSKLVNVLQDQWFCDFLSSIPVELVLDLCFFKEHFDSQAAFSARFVQVQQSWIDRKWGTGRSPICVTPTTKSLLNNFQRSLLGKNKADFFAAGLGPLSAAQHKAMHIAFAKLTQVPRELALPEDDDSDGPIRMTAQQYDAVQDPSRLKVVSGLAGTGKTLVAVEHLLRRMHETSELKERVVGIYVCFTSALCFSLRHLFNSGCIGLKVWEQGVDPSGNQIVVLTANMLRDLADTGHLHFIKRSDHVHVVVDEVQDLQEKGVLSPMNDLEKFVSFSRKSTTLMLVGDDLQKLFRRGEAVVLPEVLKQLKQKMQLTEAPQEFSLRTVLRNTMPIFDRLVDCINLSLARHRLNHLSMGNLTCIDLHPYSVEPQVVHLTEGVPSAAPFAREPILNALHSAMQSIYMPNLGGKRSFLQELHLAILVSYRPTDTPGDYQTWIKDIRSVLLEKLKIKPQHVMDAEAYFRERNSIALDTRLPIVVVDSVKKFSGCEMPAVLYVDLDRTNNTAVMDSDLNAYSAISRATTWLHVMHVFPERYEGASGKGTTLTKLKRISYEEDGVPSQSSMVDDNDFDVPEDIIVESPGASKLAKTD
jgi:hypothetical protein